MQGYLLILFFVCATHSITWFALVPWIKPVVHCVDCTHSELMSKYITSNLFCPLVHAPLYQSHSNPIHSARAMREFHSNPAHSAHVMREFHSNPTHSARARREFHSKPTHSARAMCEFHSKPTQSVKIRNIKFMSKYVTSNSCQST